MKSYRKELWFNLPSQCGLVNITTEVEKALAESGIREGLCLVKASLSQFQNLWPLAKKRVHPVGSVDVIL
jgi:hypothetical protein